MYKQLFNTTASNAKRIYSADNTNTSQGTLAGWNHYIDAGTCKMPVEACSKFGNFEYRKDGTKAYKLGRADFAYGYFDGEGVHWTLTDAIGSIELVVSGDGRVEQHTGYYPYGQPWRAVAGQQRLFGGKELRTFAGLNDYDFHARFQNPAGPFFQSADRHAANTPALSPWTFAAANPVRFTDPSGLDIYTLDGRGNMISCVKNDTIDQVVVLDQGMRHESDTYKKGTIESYSSHEAIDGAIYNIFKIKGDQPAMDLFVFLADYTNVEYSLLQCGTIGKNGLNYLSTSHNKHDDESIDYVFKELIFNKKLNLRNYWHNHPSGNTGKSDADIYTFEAILKYYKNVKFGIYGGNGTYRDHSSELPSVFGNNALIVLNIKNSNELKKLWIYLDKR